MVSSDLILSTGLAVAIVACFAAWALWAVARRPDAAVWDRFADAHGWDHQSSPSFMPWREALPAAYQDAEHVVSGAAVGGPFRAFVRQGVGTRIWIGTSTSCDGLRIRPQGAFRRHRDPAKQQGLPGYTSPLLRRYDVEGEPNVASRVVTPRVVALLTTPRRDIDVAWQGEDLWLSFPVVPSSPAALARLVRYADVLAATLQGGDQAVQLRSLQTGLPDTMRTTAGVRL